VTPAVCVSIVDSGVMTAQIDLHLSTKCWNIIVSRTHIFQPCEMDGKISILLDSGASCNLIPRQLVTSFKFNECDIMLSGVTDRSWRSFMGGANMADVFFFSWSFIVFTGLYADTADAAGRFYTSTFVYIS